MQPPKVFVLITLSLCSAVSLQAAKKIEGYYISSPGERRINTTFLIPFGFFGGEPNYERMQNEIRCIDGTEKYSLSPQQAFEISFIYNGVTVLMRSVYNGLSDGDPMFLHVVVDGPVSLYNYHESRYTPGGYSPGTGMSFGMGKQTIVRLILQRNSDELFKVRRLYFKKDLTEFFSDCPDILEKINSSSLSDLPAIVRAYNKTCR